MGVRDRHEQKKKVSKKKNALVASHLEQGRGTLPCSKREATGATKKKDESPRIVFGARRGFCHGEKTLTRSRLGLGTRRGTGLGRLQ